MRYSADECARQVLEMVPVVMRAIRTELRKHRGGDISVPQFRSLFYVSRHEGASLSQVAEHVGLTMPSMSRIVDGLVGRGLATRETHQDDRRRMTLALTSRGEATLQSASQSTEAYLSQLFGALPLTKRGTLVDAMRILRTVFAETTSPEAEEG